MKSKITVLYFSVIIMASLSGCGGGDSNLVKGSVCSVSKTEIAGASLSLNNTQDLSKGLLQTSKKLLSISNSLVKAGSMANTEYIEAMLQLSKDIGEMADRIGEMADRILVMADKIGDMSDRIVETQKIESQNVKLTQANLLQAQENFHSLLKSKANGENL